MNSKISLVIPVLNESDEIENFFNEITELITALVVAMFEKNGDQ